MKGFTYEYETKSECLETYEWDNVWWEHANDPTKPRVLYIGDSISCGARGHLNTMLEGEVYLDNLGTSKGIDNPFFADTIKFFATQQGKRCAVFFNNGLHGWHLDDETEYKQYYEKMIVFLKEEFSGTPLFLLLTTPVADAERDVRVVARNRVVAELAEKYGVPTLDYYSVIKAHTEWLSPRDGVHLTGEGSQAIGRLAVAEIQKIVKG